MSSLFICIALSCSLTLFDIGLKIYVMLRGGGGFFSPPPTYSYEMFSHGGAEKAPPFQIGLKTSTLPSLLSV